MEFTVVLTVLNTPHNPDSIQCCTVNSDSPNSVTLQTHYFAPNDLCVDDAGGVSRQMANWLKNASTVSAPNPHQRQLFGGGKSKGVRS